MSDDRLQHIQALQFTDRPAAEALLLTFIREIFPNLLTVKVELRPLAVSLNSFNGFLTLSNGHKLFFKTHVEPSSVVGEYYNSTLLAEAGYPIIHPLYASTEYGKQLLIYDLIESPSVFDVAHAIDRGERDDLDALADAQHRADDQLLQLYLHTLEWQSAEQAAQAPVHQLFYHRLGTRYDQFYRDCKFVFPKPKGYRFWKTLCNRYWNINGLASIFTLAQALDGARQVLQPQQAGWSIVGHGDAHNGNVFAMPDGLVYFDPAFSGRHHPLLDLAKPLYHNVFATWMYHPQEVLADLQISWYDDGRTIMVEHNYQPSACRMMFLQSKLDRVLAPLLSELYKCDRYVYGSKPSDWWNYLKSALLCCALLTMNLADRNRFPAEIGLLGLCSVIEMVVLNNGANLLDEHLNVLKRRIGPESAH